MQDKHRYGRKLGFLAFSSIPKYTGRSTYPIKDMHLIQTYPAYVENGGFIPSALKLEDFCAYCIIYEY